MPNHQATPEILLITLKYPPAVGGMQKQSKELITHLSKLAPAYRITFSNQFPLLFFIPILLVRTYWVLLRYPKIKTVHLNEALAALFLTPVMMLFPGRKFWVTVHGLDVVFPLSAYQWWIRRYLSRFHGIIAVSEQTKILCIKAGIPTGKVHFIPNASEISPAVADDGTDFRKWLHQTHDLDTSQKFLLASVGRPIPRKGFVHFIENVLKQLPESYAYTIAGPPQKHEKFFHFLQRVLPKKVFVGICQLQGVGLEYFEMRELEKSSEFQGRFRFLGKLSDQKLQQLYRSCDLFLMPNQSVAGDFEGFGLVALEAVAQGAVCLASAVDGIPSAIQHQVNGLLLPPDDPAKWRSTIVSLCENLHLRQTYQSSFSQAQLSSSYSWAEMAHLYLKCFHQYQ